MSISSTQLNLTAHHVATDGQNFYAAKGPEIQIINSEGRLLERIMVQNEILTLWISSSYLALGFDKQVQLIALDNLLEIKSIKINYKLIALSTRHLCLMHSDEKTLTVYSISPCKGDEYVWEPHINTITTNSTHVFVSLEKGVIGYFNFDQKLSSYKHLKDGPDPIIHLAANQTCFFAGHRTYVNYFAIESGKVIGKISFHANIIQLISQPADCVAITDKAIVCFNNENYLEIDQTTSPPSNAVICKNAIMAVGHEKTVLYKFEQSFCSIL